MALDFFYKLHIFAAKPSVRKQKNVRFASLSLIFFFILKLLAIAAFIYVSVQSISLEMICSLVHSIIFVFFFFFSCLLVFLFCFFLPFAQLLFKFVIWMGCCRQFYFCLLQTMREKKRRQRRCPFIVQQISQRK